MSEKKRKVSTGEFAAAVLLALAVGFYGGTVFMQLRTPAQGVASGPAAAAPDGASALSAEDQARIRELEIATASKSGDQGLWVDLGNLYFDTHQPQKAITAYGKAIALGPASPDVWTDLGIMYREAKQPKKAVESFDQALAQNPRHENALYNKGVVQLHDLGDRAGAAATWGRLVAVNPAAKTPEGKLVKDMIAELKRG